MIDRKDLKGMICALKKGEVIWYAPDHDYGPAASVFVPLFAVDQSGNDVGDPDAGKDVESLHCSVLFRDVNPTVKVMS